MGDRADSKFAVRIVDAEPLIPSEKISLTVACYGSRPARGRGLEVSHVNPGFAQKADRNRAPFLAVAGKYSQFYRRVAKQSLPIHWKPNEYVFDNCFSSSWLKRRMRNITRKSLSGGFISRSICGADYDD